MVEKEKKYISSNWWSSWTEKNTLPKCSQVPISGVNRKAFNTDFLSVRTDEQSNGKNRFPAILVRILRTIARWKALGE
jgi:hypothetical protein